MACTLVMMVVISGKVIITIYDVVFYGALLETDKETFYEIIHPGETKDFKTKYFAPKGTDSVALKVIGAKNTP